MKASASNKSLHWSLRILLWINIINSLLLIGAYFGALISPNSLGYLSFLGLAYPILLLISFLFILLWVFFKRKLILISLLTIAIGWNHLHHYYAINWVQNDLGESVKIMSYNVRIFNLYDKENRISNRNDIFEFLKEEDNDIICFQEFYHQDNSSTFVTKDSMVKLLNTNYYHERYTHEMSRKRYFGVATFSKYPIVFKGEISFDNDANNFCIYSDIKIGEDTIRVFNAHLGSIRLQSDDYEFFGDEVRENYPIQKDAGQRIVKRLKIAFEKRALQAEKVAKVIERSPYPVIVCVDLNDTPISYAYRQFNKTLNDAFVDAGNGVGQTYIGKLPSNRIDYIFYGDEFKTANFTTHQVNLSDHKPISSHFEIDSE
jgi:endonuclease/exonuclease/phosphatase family metal-dependent hydrolase